LNELAFCRRFASGTRQSVIVIRPFCTTRRAILCRILSTWKPLDLFSTMKPLTWLSSTSRAQTMVRSPHVELPIHFFCPLSTQVSPSRLAVVLRPREAADPTSGSVRPKEPIISIAAIFGSHSAFCASEPQ